MRLKEIREQRRYTQAELARYFDIPLRTYQNYEREINDPSSDFLCKLADFYGVSTDYLLGKTDIPNQPNPTAIRLSEKDWLLLELFHRMPEESKDLLIKNAQAFANSGMEK